MSSLEKKETKNISLKAESKELMKDSRVNTKTGFSISGAINRKEFGLTGMPLWKPVVFCG